MARYTLKYAKPYLDPKDLAPMHTTHKVSFDFYGRIRDAEKRALIYLPKTALEHNGETYRPFPLVLWKEIKEW